MFDCIPHSSLKIFCEYEWDERKNKRMAKDKECLPLNYSNRCLELYSSFLYQNGIGLTMLKKICN